MNTVDLLLRDVLPEEELVGLVNVVAVGVAEAEERVLAAGVDVTALKVLGGTLGDGVVGNALKVEGAAGGCEDAEGHCADGLAIVLAGGEVLDLEGGDLLVGGGSGSSQSSGAEKSSGGGSEELHFGGVWCWMVMRLES